MKILAVRLAEVGCFSAPVALEGLSGGLNVLTGVNEAGKSTFLAALRLAFEREYKTAHRDAEALRPYSGGAPLIEVDFAVADATWRLRKRYLASKSAELRNLSTGQVTRGADAENLLTELLTSAGGKSSLGLLWAAQNETLTVEAPSDEAATGLKRAIAAEIATTVGGGEARHVRSAIRKELETYVTAQRGQPKGEYDAALKHNKRLTIDLEIATARRDAALERLDRLAGLKLREAELDDPAESARLATVAAEAESAVAAASDALQKQRIAADAVTSAETALALASNTRDSFARDVASLASLTSASLEDQDSGRELASRLADAEARAADARETRDASRHALMLAERELKAALQSERRQEAHRRLAEQQAVLAAIDVATDAGIALRARLDALPITVDLLRRMRGADEAVRRHEDRVSTAAPKITIAYHPGAAGRISHTGMALPEGQHIVERALTLDIDGIGTLTVAPGASRDLEATTAAIAQHRDELATLLADVGVADIEEAETQLFLRQSLEGEIAEARARLGALTPAGGIARLRVDIESLAASLAVETDEPIRMRMDVESDVERLKQDLTQAEPTDEAAQRAVFQQRELMARHSASSSDRQQRIAEFEARLPPELDRPLHADRHAAVVAEAERALHSAVREHAAWREQVPDASRLRELELESSRASDAVRLAARQLEDVRRAIASLEGELRGDRNDDVEARVAELEGALALVNQRVSRMTDDVAALQLLDTELRNEETRSRDQYLRPITDRLAPLINLVFPGADVTVAENFVPASLRRASEREAIGALSGGTQEQLAVMVRLAFGRLMADAGNAVPVILDDALVYSDDERILRMFAALITASQHHQVVIFTCRSRAFESLQAHRLSIDPWQGDAESRQVFSIAG